MNKKSSKGSQNRLLWAILPLAFVTVAWFLLNPYFVRRAEIREIERIIGTEFPKHYSDLVIEYPTEFALVGSMTVAPNEVEPFLQKMGFTKETHFLALATWGSQAEFFSNPSNLEKFTGVYGAILHKNGWEFAYDPDKNRLWFFMGYSIPE